MNTPRVSREQAEGLKKVGYDVKCHAHYECTKKEEKLIEYSIRENWNTDDTFGMRVRTSYFSAPTLDEATRWLREVKGWHVAVDTTGMGWYLFCTEIKGGSVILPTKNNFDTHELALSAGIDLILKKLEER
jgi:hypothetical protein